MQQQSALALFKLKPKNPYYFWAVMSVVLQAVRGQGAQDRQQKAVLLTLAQRMIDKLVSEGKLDAEQELQLYLMVLELRGEDERALEVLDGPLGRKLMAGQSEKARIPYLVRMGRWSDVNLVCRELLRANADRWDIWQHYLESVLKLDDAVGTCGSTSAENGTYVDGGPDDSAEKAHEFICSLVPAETMFKDGGDVCRQRGPYLARLELCSRLHDSGRPLDVLGDPLELLVEYFRSFGHKACCSSDLRPYLRMLDGARRQELGARLLKDVGICGSTLPQSERQLRRHVAALQLSRLCGAHQGLDQEYLRALITALALHYRNGASAFAPPRPATDQAPADAYALLAAHALHDLARATRRSRPHVAALALLERLLRASPSNFHARLLCVRLYHLIGAGEGAQRCFEPLDAKHLQLDSLGFVHCARLPQTGLLPLTAVHQEAAARFFAANYRDSVDHLTFSYKFGSFSKLEEFMDFRERLRDSLHRACVSVDHALYEISTGTPAAVRAVTMPELSESEKLRDNNDYAVYASWDPARVSSPNAYRQRFFEQERALYRIRLGLLRIMLAARDRRREEIPALVDDWERNLDEAAAAHPDRLDHSDLADPAPGRLHSHLRDDPPYRRLLAPLARQAADPSKDNAAALRDQLRGMARTFADAIDNINRREDPLFERYLDTELVASYVEVACLAAALCAACADRNTVSAGASGSRKKKTASSSDGSASLVREATDALGLLDKALASWETPSAAPEPQPADLSDGLRSLSISDADDERTVLDAVHSSHATAVRELRTAIASRIKYLGSAPHC